MNYTWATATHVGHLRDNNEDAVSPTDDGSGSGPVVVAVADGMGGHAAGEIASRIAIDAAGTGAPGETDMAARVARANEAVLAAVGDDPGVAGMGTTLTIGVFDPAGTMHVGHVGDSRLYLLRDGALEQVTVDHTWVMELVARGQISPTDATTHPRRHLLSRVVGMEGVQADVIEVALEAGDRVLFCSDGLTGMVPDGAIGMILGEAETPSGAAWALVEAANTGGGVDNTTVAVVDVCRMTRTAEAALLAVAAVIAAMGVALVNFTRGIWLDAQVALTFLIFVAAFGAIHAALRRWAPAANPYVFPLAAFLTAIGFIEVYRLDSDLAGLQRWWLLVAAGISVLVLFLLRDEGVEALRRYRYLFLAAAVVLLLLPLLPTSWPIHGAIVNGSRLWVRFEMPFGGRTLSFQPGEIAKVFLAIFLASYLAERHTAMAAADRTLGPLRIPPLREFGPVVIAALASFGVLVYQRDLGASLLLFALFIGLIYIATGRAAYVGVGALFIAVGGLFAYQMFDHVQRRIEAWLRPFDDFTGSGFQIAQSLFALGSGSLTGSGLGLGEPNRIPFASTDFIFAAIGEEMGYAGTIAVLAGFALLTAAGFGIALRARDVFRKFLAAALTLLLAVQAILILGGVLRVMPVTGITLPFMSYGGSALLTNLVMITLLARISHGERS